MKPTSQGAQRIQQEDDGQKAGALIPRPPGDKGGDDTPPQNDRKALSPARMSPARTHNGSADVRRERALKSLAGRLADLQARLASVREATRELSTIELERRLKPDETRRARTLRWESEHLSHELKLLRESFEALAAESRAAQPNRLRPQDRGGLIPADGRLAID